MDDISKEMPKAFADYVCVDLSKLNPKGNSSRARNIIIEYEVHPEEEHYLLALGSYVLAQREEYLKVGQSSDWVDSPKTIKLARDLEIHNVRSILDANINHMPLNYLADPKGVSQKGVLVRVTYSAFYVMYHDTF